MSRLTGGNLNVASRTTFDALEVDTGEESEEEIHEVAPPPETLVLLYGNSHLTDTTMQSVPGGSKTFQVCY
jgi:hypothetical protein